MRRLSDGLFALYRQDDTSSVGDVSGGTRAEVLAEQSSELARLAQGEPDAEPRSALAERLLAEGLVVEGAPAVDPRVYAHLERIGAGFRWTLPDDENTGEVLALLRRAHARRKIFVQDFGQTPCLPESGLARCLALKAAVGEGARVLLIGDDDLLSLALSALGFDVTAIDIDPLVVEFVNAVAKDEGLSLVSKVYDVLAPLDENMVGAFDAVLTDPMSYENCQVAFLSRALAVVKEGGVVLTCVHPVARRTFARVKTQLPVTVERYRNLFSAYYYYGYSENTYRSDLVELVRVPGPLHYPPEVRIPFEAITEGRLSAGFHGLTDVVGSRLGLNKRLNAAAVVNEVNARDGYAVIDAFGVDDGEVSHAFFVLEGGGHLALSVDKARARAALDVYPFDEARDRALTALVAQNIRGRKEATWYTDAPHIPALPVCTGEEG